MSEMIEQNPPCIECGKPIEHITVDALCHSCRAEWLEMPAGSLYIYQPKALTTGFVLRAQRDEKKVDIAGYEVEVFGKVINPGEHIPRDHLRFPDKITIFGNNSTVFLTRAAVWLQRAFYRDSRIYVERIWHPNKGWNEAIRGIEHAKKSEDIKHAWQGIRLLRMIETRGNKPDNPWKKPERDALIQQANEMRWEQGMKVEDIAAELGKNAKTISNWTSIPKHR